MGKPAARMGDMTAHGGVIVVGCPTVLIGGQPAARVGDMHTCPMQTPAGPAPIPHVGGPILPPGSPTVLIGGMPAARVGDMATCVGPPDTILPPGCPTVLIGEAGGGGGGGAGGGSAAAASAGAHSALVGTPGKETAGLHWIEYKFVDSAGNPVTGLSYEYTDVNGNMEKGILTGNGIIRRGGMSKEGNCKVKLFTVHSVKWSKDKAEVGEAVKLSAETEGYGDGTPAVFKIFEKDIDGIDNYVTELETTVKGNKVEAEWKYEIRDDEYEPEKKQQGYSAPKYYFFVHIEKDKARSDLLEFKDWIEIELKDQDNNPIPNKNYIICLKNGEIRKGKLNSQGFAKEEKVPPGEYKVDFPDDIEKSIFKSEPKS